MPLDARVRDAAAAYVSVLWHYDGLGGSVIRWTHENGNDNDDPSVLAWVLDPEGNVIANLSRIVYNAASLASALEEHSRTSFPLVDPMEFEVLRKEARAIAARKKLGGTVASLRRIASGESGSDEAARAEGERLLGVILPHAEWKFERAEERKTSDPPAALALYRELAKVFAGDEIGERARGILDELEKDESFQAERKAHARLSAVTRAAEGLDPCSGDRSVRIKDCEDCRRKNAAVLREAKKALEGIVERWPETAAAGRAGKLLEFWGLNRNP